MQMAAFEGYPPVWKPSVFFRHEFTDASDRIDRDGEIGGDGVDDPEGLLRRSLH